MVGFTQFGKTPRLYRVSLKQIRPTSWGKRMKPYYIVADSKEDAFQYIDGILKPEVRRDWQVGAVSDCGPALSQVLFGGQG